MAVCRSSVFSMVAKVSVDDRDGIMVNTKG
jgi:hypothetical protein